MVQRPTRGKRTRPRRMACCGFALIDLLVLLAGMGLLVSLVLPAVQWSRETARRSQCTDNLRQLGEACRHHESAIGHLPTNGWAPFWIGDPNRGTGAKQPGGWIFNILPYLGQQGLYDLQSGLTDKDAQQAAAIQLIQTPLAVLNCPSRRPAIAYPVTGPPDGGRYIGPGDFLQRGVGEARSDYAANGGSVHCNALDAELYKGKPREGTKGVDALFANGKAAAGAAKVYAMATGIFFPESQITMAEIADGASNTYLCGEKYVQASHYLDGKNYGDHWGMYTGDCIEITRWAGPDFPPAHDNREESLERSLGSAHPGAFNMCFCDGSVRAIPYTVDLTVHERLANRKDGERVTPDF